MANLEGGCAVTGPTLVSELEFGECCFCESRGEHRNMMSKPVSEGDQENYFEMLLECFNVYVATGSMGRSLICTSCASRLRDARDFKQLVLRAHARLRGAATSMAVEVSRPVSNVKIKLEPEEPPGETAEPDSDYCGVVVKSEPDMEIVEHGLMRRTDLKSGFREDNGTTDKMLGDGQTEPKKQRLGKQETTKMDTTLAGMLSCPQEPMELKTENEITTLNMMDPCAHIPSTSSTPMETEDALPSTSAIPTTAEKNALRNQITTLNMMDPCAHIPSTSSTPMETEDALPSTSAIPTTAEKNALRNREYRKRVAATRTPEQAAAFARKAAERQRKAYHLRRAANLALASGTVETTRIVQTSAQRKRASRQRQAERVRSAAQPSTSSNQAAVHQEQPTWSTKWSSSIHRFKSTFLDNDFG